MSSITEIARTFFEACEKGKGWEGCSEYCTADATFSAQAEPLLDVKTLEQYADGRPRETTTSEPMIPMSEIEDARQSLEIKLQRIRESLESR